MPFRHPYALRTRILERVAAGEPVKAICRDPGMPCPESVTGWMRREPSFAAEMARARAVGDWARRSRPDAARQAEIVARLRAGEAIADIVRGPAMPSYRTYMRWRALDASFAEAVASTLAMRAARKHARLRARFRTFDPAIADRIYVGVFKGAPLRRLLRGDPSLPSLAVVTRWRREQPEFDARLAWAMAAWRQRRGRDGTLCSPQLTERIVGGLIQGESLRSLGRRPDMPCAGTMYAWVRDRLDFAAEVDAACRQREHWYAERMQAALDRMTDAISQKVVRRRLTHYRRQLARLRKRPGWKRARG